MKCPLCVEEGEKSTVREDKTPYATYEQVDMSSTWYDEDGIYHHHDPRERVSYWECSRGHRLVKSSVYKCPAGDFGGEVTVGPLVEG